MYIGPMATGTTVVANSVMIDKQIRSQFAHTATLIKYVVIPKKEQSP